jgi:hypothetical protein
LMLGAQRISKHDLDQRSNHYTVSLTALVCSLMC